MIANYHSHTVRCNHATGTMEEFVEAAMERGMKIFGFSDHTPQYFPGDYYTFMRMKPYELPEYCMDVHKLQKQYRDRMQIHLGLEVEYYPAYWDQLIPRLRDAGIEYIILGQHWLGNEMGEPGSASVTSDEQILRRYCRQVCEAMETGKFTYIAHPGYINYVGDAKIYQRHIRDLCRTAKQTNTPLEINFLGLAYGRHYPNPLLWEVAAEEGCSAIFGVDGHSPAQIRNALPEEKALELVQRFGLNLLETVEFKPL